MLSAKPPVENNVGLPQKGHQGLGPCVVEVKPETPPLSPPHAQKIGRPTRDRLIIQDRKPRCPQEGPHWRAAFAGSTLAASFANSLHQEQSRKGSGYLRDYRQRQTDPLKGKNESKLLRANRWFWDRKFILKTPTRGLKRRAQQPKHPPCKQQE